MLLRLPRVYPILDTAALARLGCSLIDAAQAMLDGGAQILQLRSKGLLTQRLVEETEQLAGMCRRFDARFIVNDRADLSMLAGAGLHLGQEDLPPVAARRLMGPSAVIGYSTHNEEQLMAGAQEPIDYLALGPIFATQSKENPDPVVGVEGLRRLRPLTDLPLVAIGGIAPANAAAVFDAGADSIALIRALLPEPCTKETIRERMEEWQKLARN